MTTEETKTKAPVISLVAVRNEKDPAIMAEQSTAEMLNLGFNAVKEIIESGEVKAFFTITFDKVDSSPRIIWAGDIDTLKTLGALEVAKNEFFKSIFSLGPDEE